MYLFTDRPWKTWKNEKDTRHDEGKITTINKDPISIYKSVKSCPSYFAKNSNKDAFLILKLPNLRAGKNPLFMSSYT